MIKALVAKYKGLADNEVIRQLLGLPRYSVTQLIEKSRKECSDFIEVLEAVTFQHVADDVENIQHRLARLHGLQRQHRKTEALFFGRGVIKAVHQHQRLLVGNVLPVFDVFQKIKAYSLRNLLGQKISGLDVL